MTKSDNNKEEAERLLIEARAEKKRAASAPSTSKVPIPKKPVVEESSSCDLDSNYSSDSSSNSERKSEVATEAVAEAAIEAATEVATEATTAATIDVPVAEPPTEQEITMEQILMQNARLRLELDSQSRTTLAKIPDPDFYYGESHKLNGWLTQVALKCNGNAKYFPSESSKILYAFALLRGKALDWATLYIDREAKYKLFSLSELANKLKKTFGNLNPTATAERKLYELRQHGKTCAELRTKFERIMFDLGWDGKAKISAFREALDPSLKERLIRRDNLPEEYKEYTKLCVRINNDLRAFQQEQKQKRRLFIPRYTPEVTTPRWELTIRTKW